MQQAKIGSLYVIKPNSRFLVWSSLGDGTHTLGVLEEDDVFVCLSEPEMLRMRGWIRVMSRFSIGWIVVDEWNWQQAA